MQPKLQKKSETRSSKGSAWHLDFRVADRLPDVKPIRTAFFVNGLAILLAIGISLNFAHQEYELYSLHSQIDQWNEQIESDSRPSAAAVKMFQNFKVEEKRINEAAAFVKVQISGSDFLLRLGAILPPNITIDTVDWRSGLITLRGSVSGSPDDASGYASSFVEVLNSDPVLSPVFENATLTSLARNTSTGTLTMELRLTFSPTT